MAQVDRRVTIGGGSDKGKGTSLSFQGLTGVVDFLTGQRGEEVWWSCHRWTDDRRQTKNWAGSSMVVVDVDRHLGGSKTPLPESAWEALCEAFRDGLLPGHWIHRTPHGLRVVALLDRFSEEAAEWHEAATAVVQMVDDALTLNPALANMGLAVDAPTTFDRARLFWGPFATVGGVERDGQGVTNSQRPAYALETLKAPRGGYVAGKARPAARGRRGTSEEWRAARLKFVEANPLPPVDVDRVCPACGHKGCLNALPEDATRYWCWSTSHAFADGRACGRPVGDPATGEVRGWMFDALDLASFLQGKSPTRILIDAQLLTPEAARGPDDSLPEVLRAGKHVLPNGDVLQIEEKQWAEEVLSHIVDTGILYRKGDLAQMVYENERLVVVNDHMMAGIAGEHVQSMKWVKPRKKDSAPFLQWSHHTRADGNAIKGHAAYSFVVPKVDIVVRYPVFAGPKMRLVQPGYNEDSRILYIPDRVTKSIEPAPINEGHKPELREMLLTLVEDFPFDSQADAENAIMVMLTMLVRPCVDISPLFYVGAQRPGTGKTKLCQSVIARTLTGKNWGVIDIRESAEREKRISSLAVNGDPLIIFDNLDTDVKVEGGSLASWLTSPTWDLRILGKTQKVSTDNRAVVIANGNNNDFSGEIARRVWPIMLRTPSARPEERTDIVHTRLDHWIDEMRPRVLKTLMGMVEGWKAAGCPEHTLHREYAEFVQWREIVFGVMEWMGFREFGNNLAKFKDDTQEEIERDANALVTFWVESGRAQTAHTIDEIFEWVRQYGWFEESLTASNDPRQGFKFGVMRKLWKVPLRSTANGHVRDFRMVKRRVDTKMKVYLKEIK